MGKLIPRNEDISDQLVLQFFESGVAITKSPKEISYKKANAVIKTVAALGLLELKVIDACYFIARNNLLDDTAYVAKLDYFKWLINYNSKNNDYLKNAITKIQQTLIQLNVIDHNNPETEFWLSTNYIYEVAITSRNIYFGIPETVRKQLADPQTYTMLSLRIKNRFKSEYAYKIYDRCRLDAYRGATDWILLPELREITNAGELSLYPEFKEYKRRVLDIAVKQINEFSDILISVDFKRTGKFVTHIKFIIEENPNYHGSPEREFLPPDVFNDLKDIFGLSNSDINVIAAEHSVENIKSKIEFTKYRMTLKDIPRPDAYFLKALREDLRLTPNDLAKINDNTKKVKEKEKQAVLLEEKKEIDTKRFDRLHQYLAMDKDNKASILEQFLASSWFTNVSRFAKNKKASDMIEDTKNNVIKTAFIDFINELSAKPPSA